MRKLILVAFAVLCAFSAFAKVNVVVTIVPQKFFVEKIAGDKANISVMVPAGSSPHSYEPKPKQMTELSKANIYFSIGETSEHVWLDKFKSMNKKMLIADTTAAIEKIEMAEHHHHDEEAEHDHEHEGEAHEKDPHVWLDPILVMKQAKVIADSLSAADRANAAFYTANYNKFVKELTELDKTIANTLKKAIVRKFMVFHPSWGYFAKRYKLEQISVEIEGKAPKAQELTELIKTAKAQKLKVIFAQPQFSMKDVKTIADETGAKVVVINPLAENWAESLLNTAKTIAGN